MPSFNLAYEPWIPCLLRGERLPQEFSLLDTLTRAHEIRELSDDSPLVTIALHRLLLAILHRNFGPSGFTEWKRLWQREQWDGEVLANYFAAWKQRFDLFDAERPFFQVSFDLNLKKDPLTLLAQEFASGNNATLFDHSFGSSQTFTPAQAVRFLLSRQSFAFSGTGGYLNSTLVNSYTVFVLGNSLFETLALNLLDYNAQLPVPHRGVDLPCWEQEQPDRSAKEKKDGTLPLGYLDYLTWQSRRIHLIANGEPPTVSQCQHLQNLKLKDERGDIDPFKCYKQEGKGPLTAKRIIPAKMLWRDSHALFEQSGQAAKRPEVFNHLARINQARRRGEIKAAPVYAFAIYGMANEQASVSLWARERLPLPLSYLSEKPLTSALDEALKVTEEIAKNLARAVKTLASHLVNKLKSLAGEKDASKLAESFGAQEFFWSRLDPAFKKFLVALAADQSADESEYGETTLPEWARLVTRTASGAFAQAANSLSDSARELEAIALAQTEFDKLMGKTRKNFPRLFPPTSTTQSTNGGQS
jgi:CRISPR system Cascade subunit CasA